jgi:PKD repeat protein
VATVGLPYAVTATLTQGGQGIEGEPISFQASTVEVPPDLGRSPQLGGLVPIGQPAEETAPTNAEGVARFSWTRPAETDDLVTVQAVRLGPKATDTVLWRRVDINLTPNPPDIVTGEPFTLTAEVRLNGVPLAREPISFRAEHEDPDVALEDNTAATPPDDDDEVTDASGRARFRWTRTTAGDDTITVRARSTTVNSSLVWITNEPPNAQFVPTIVEELRASFDASRSRDVDGRVVSYAWDFGDGTTGSGAQPSHLYAAGGTYTVTLTVTDDRGATNATSHDITVPNQPPVASFEATVDGRQASFDASASDDPDGRVASYRWDFGDESPEGSGVTPTHAYPSDGTYTVTLTVTDDRGATNATSHDVTIRNQPPEASFEVVAVDGRQASFDASASKDPDGRVDSYRWDFGD